MAMIDIASAGLSDIGRKRHSNQDSFLLDDAHHLYMVADGMGGHQAGEVASQLVVDSIHQYFLKSTPDGDKTETAQGDPFLSPDANRLREAIYYANQQVYHAAESNKAYKGMGSTLAAVQFVKNTFIAANVGDSPIYLIHEKSIETLSVPHTLMAEQQDFSPEDQALFGPELQHMLTRGMGVEGTVKPDICESPCFIGDRLVVCSDGLSGKISPEEILDVVISKSTANACQTLVDMANHRGGDDNITVVVLHVIAQNALFQRLTHWLTNFKRVFN
jgi:serine/threonine protein phosphatase PrpC